MMTIRISFPSSAIYVKRARDVRFDHPKEERQQKKNTHLMRVCLAPSHSRFYLHMANVDLWTQ